MAGRSPTDRSPSSTASLPEQRSKSRRTGPSPARSLPTPDTSGSTPTGTTPSEPTTTIAGGQSACAPGEYTILAEDTSRVKVAKKLDTTVEALDAANVNTKGYGGFFPGLKIKTPPKADC